MCWCVREWGQRAAGGVVGLEPAALRDWIGLGRCGKGSCSCQRRSTPTSCLRSVGPVLLAADARRHRSSAAASATIVATDVHFGLLARRKRASARSTTWRSGSSTPRASSCRQSRARHCPPPLPPCHDSGAPTHAHTHVRAQEHTHAHTFRARTDHCRGRVVVIPLCARAALQRLQSGPRRSAPNGSTLLRRFSAGPCGSASSRAPRAPRAATSASSATCIASS